MQRRMLHRLVVVSVLPLVAIASSASAQPQSPDDEDPPVTVVKEPPPPPLAPAIRVDVGMGSAVGGLGVVLTRPLAPQLAIEAGAGFGFSGLQLSLMGKWQRGTGRWRFTPGLGLSLGIPLGEPNIHSGHPPGDDEKRGRGVVMPWLDADLLGVEYRGPSGFVFAASAGLNVALAHGHWDVGDMGGDISPGDPAPQFRLGFGKTF